MKKSIVRIVTFMFVLITVISMCAVPALAGSQQDAIVSCAQKYIGKSGRDLGVNFAWCVYFVVRSAKDAGLVKSGLFPGNIYSCTPLANWFTSKNKGKCYYFKRSATMNNSKNNIKSNRNTFTPKKGDIVEFIWKGNRDGIFDHVGLVTGYSNGKITYIDGNSGSGNTYTRRVKSNTRSRTDTQIAAYIRPNYSGEVKEDKPKNDLQIQMPSSPVLVKKGSSTTFTVKFKGDGIDHINGTNSCRDVWGRFVSADWRGNPPVCHTQIYLESSSNDQRGQFTLNLFNKQDKLLKSASVDIQSYLHYGQVTAKSGLNLRKGPSTGHQKYTAITKGTKIPVLTILSNGWAKVLYKGKTLYCDNQYLKKV